MSSLPKRWHKNNKAARFIVRKLLEGEINKDSPNIKTILEDYPDFGEYNITRFRRNFKNTITRWNTFVQNGQGESTQRF